MYVCFINSDEPPKEIKHICWFVNEGHDYGGKRVLILGEVIEETYPHPDAPEDAIVKRLNYRYIKSVSEIDADIEKLILAAEKACSKLNPIKSTSKTVEIR